MRRIVGQSMYPSFREGRTVLAIRASHFRLGNVVVAKIDGREVIKRITKLRGTKFWLEGDNKLASTDSRTYGWVLKDAILGKVIWPKV